jgi:soluble lytic murein transglycosylase
MRDPFKPAARPLLAQALLVAAALLGALVASHGAAASTSPTPQAARLNPAVLQSGNQRLLAARDALRRGDGPALAAARDALRGAGHPLAQWADYWELTNRLPRAGQEELDAFYARWSGTYVEDRLRNDWLLELGRRRDWANFRAEFPRFRLNDDRSVTCWAVLARHLDGQEVRAAALAAWQGQRESDDGCAPMAQVLAEAGVITPADAWVQARRFVEAGRQRLAHAAVELAHGASGPRLNELWANPLRALQAGAPAGSRTRQELALLALLRLAALDPAAAAEQLQGEAGQALAPDQAALAWGVLTKQAGLRLMPEAAEHARRTWRAALQAAQPGAATGAVSEPASAAAAGSAASAGSGWSDDLLAWQVRAALRIPGEGPQRWAIVDQAIAAMSPAEQADPAWVYWRARAALARAPAGPDGEAQRADARRQLAAIANPLHFYGQLALEETGQRLMLPPPPAPLSAEERAAARAHPGLDRALQLFALGLRSEAVREWNFSLRGKPERALLAAAQWACEREVWDRCINTSDRTRGEIDIAQRYPTPMRERVLAVARDVGVDPAYMYGLIRQESRFIMDARSSVGASGLMQLMPATARYTARRIGMPFDPRQIDDRDTNLRLGASYLRIVLEDFGGQQALAAAAYNAGPSRPRRWREGATLDAAAWAETVPFTETRDYVKKVLANAAVYAAVLGTEPPSLRTRLGVAIGPRDPNAPAPDRQIP